MSYTLQLYYADAWADVSGLALQSLSVRDISRAASELSFAHDCDPTAPALVIEKDTIALRAVWADQTTTMLFAGLVTEVAFDADTCSITALNYWYLLENIVYQVPWTLNVNAYNKSHLILCRAEDGSRMTTGAQIKVALDYAIAEGININYAQSDLDALTIEPPVDEQTDLTVAEVLTKLLRWHPAVSTCFDYNESAPDGPHTLRLLDESAATPVTQPATGINRRSFKVKKLLSRKVDGVVLNYEIQNETIDGTTQEIQTDSAGATSGPFVLIHTASLDGSYVQNETASINLQVAAWPSDWADNLSFVQSIFGATYVCNLLSDVIPSSISSPYYVVSGYEEGYGVSVTPIEVGWEVWEKWDKSWDPIWGTEYLNRIPCNEDPVHSTGWKKVWKKKTFLFTNSTSGTYDRTDQITIPGEEIPTDTAASIYAALNRDHYEGSFSQPFNPPQASDIWTPGRQRINIAGHRPELGTMAESVSDVMIDWLAGTRRLSFGPPGHLGPSDLITLLEENRLRNQPTRRTWMS